MKQVSELYAEALFDAAVSLECADRVSAELQDIAELAGQSGGYFGNPRISADVKTGAIRELLTGKIEPLTMEFILLLLRRSHWRHLPGAAQYFRGLCDDYNGKVTVTLRIPFVPEQETLDRLRSSFIAKGLIPENAKEISLRIMEDKSIVGGFIAYCGGRQIDASLRAQLEKIRSAER